MSFMGCGGSKGPALDAALDDSKHVLDPEDLISPRGSKGKATPRDDAKARSMTRSKEVEL